MQHWYSGLSKSCVVAITYNQKLQENTTKKGERTGKDRRMEERRENSLRRILFTIHKVGVILIDNDSRVAVNDISIHIQPRDIVEDSHSL